MRARDRAPRQLLTSVVLDFLREGRVPPRAASLGLSHADVHAAAETFVSAGARALVDVRPTSWLGWGVSLALPSPSSDATAEAVSVVAAFRALIDDCQRDRAVSNCYFMRKPPGVRLRIETSSPARIERKVARWLEAHSLAAEPLPYEPEEYQFGGHVGMTIAHRQFSSDSVAALDVTLRALAGTLSAPVWGLSLLSLLQLGETIASDRWELWDLWSGLRLTGRLGETSRDDDELISSVAAQVAPFVDRSLRRARSRRLDPSDGAILKRLARTNARAARDLVSANRRKELLYGPRQILPFWIVFHWNRWGFPYEEQVSLACGAERVLDPKRAATDSRTQG